MKNQTSKANTAAAQMPELSHWRDRTKPWTPEQSDVIAWLVSQPDISRHPTRGICRHCGRVMPRAYIAFCGGWTPLRECDSCVRSPRIAAQMPARQAEARERTEPRYA